MNLNKVFILGNLTRDPEMRSMPSGQPVVSFGVATNRFFKNQQGERQQDTEFHNITAFGKLAEIVSQYLKKGSLVLIEGRLKTRSWQDNGGIKHFRTEIIAESLQLGPKNLGSQTNQPMGRASGYQRPDQDNIPVIEEEPTPNKEKENKNSQGKEGQDQNGREEKSAEEEIKVEDIPF